MIDQKIASVSNIFVKMMYFHSAGDIMEGHSHNFNHLTLLAKGKLNVTVDGVTTEFSAPNMIYILKDKEHTLEATSDATVAYCIHALRDLNDEILPDDIIPEGIRTRSETAPLTTNITNN